MEAAALLPGRNVTKKLALVMALQGDNELKRLLASPVRNAPEEGCMAPPLTVS